MAGNVNGKRGAKQKSGRLFVGLLAWTVSIAAGFCYIAKYEFTAGVTARPPLRQSAETKTPELLVFVHPQCPCSRATLTELDRIVAAAGGRLQEKVFVYAPQNEPGAWAQGSLFGQASRIPGVNVVLDRDGETARRYGVRTSGQVLLYGPDGRLAFTGGITGSRGHEGDNAGEDAVLAYIRGDRAPRRSTPVFGCSLGLSSTARDNR